MFAKQVLKCIKNAKFWYTSRLQRFPFCRMSIQVTVLFDSEAKPLLHYAALHPQSAAVPCRVQPFPEDY